MILEEDPEDPFPWVYTLYLLSFSAMLLYYLLFSHRACGRVLERVINAYLKW